MKAPNKINRLIERLLKRKTKTFNKFVLCPVENSKGKYIFYCPGCEDYHLISTIKTHWNRYHVLTGTLLKPTIRASVLSKEDKEFNKPRCHSYITEGKIHFLIDSTHRLAGKTVNLPPCR